MGTDTLNGILVLIWMDGCCELVMPIAAWSYSILNLRKRSAYLLPQIIGDIPLHLQGLKSAGFRILTLPPEWPWALNKVRTSWPRSGEYREKNIFLNSSWVIFVFETLRLSKKLLHDIIRLLFRHFQWLHWNWYEDIANVKILGGFIIFSQTLPVI